MGLGAVLGSGKQWVPWITVNDVVGAIHHCLTNDAISGPVNVVGPNPVTNREFTKTLGRVLRRPAFFWLPRLALRAMFGEIADEALLASIKAVPKKLLDTGFAFDHADLAAGLRFLLGR
jgi:NAD dependent epimerase/dehydratase family enzyme